MLRLPWRKGLRVVLSTGGETEITQGITLILRKLSIYAIDVKEFAEAADLVTYARQKRPDVFIIVLNNIRFTDGRYPTVGSRITGAICLLSELKEAYGSGMIALSGWYPDDEGEDGFARRVKTAGADFFFLLPPDGKELVAAVEFCGARSAAHSTKYFSG